MATIELLTRPNIWCYGFLSKCAAPTRIKRPEDVRAMLLLSEIGDVLVPSLALIFRWTQFSPKDTYVTGIQFLDTRIKPGDIPQLLTLPRIRPSSHKDGVLTIRPTLLELSLVTPEGTVTDIICREPPEEMKLPVVLTQGLVPLSPLYPPA